MIIKRIELAGGGGLILNLHGIIELRFSWGLVCMTNNQGELYGFLLGVILVKYLHPPNLMTIRNYLISI